MESIINYKHYKCRRKLFRFEHVCQRHAVIIRVLNVRHSFRTTNTTSFLKIKVRVPQSFLVYLDRNLISATYTYLKWKIVATALRKIKAATADHLTSDLHDADLACAPNSPRNLQLPISHVLPHDTVGPTRLELR